jgi:arylformamidase
MKKVYDISVTVTPTIPVWPGDPRVVLERVKKIEEGANANASFLECGVHAGTHMDAPRHFIPGAKGIDEIPVERLFGPAQVVALDDSVAVISAEVLARIELKPGIERVLFKTRNSAYWADRLTDFQPGFVGIDESAAKALVEKGIRLVGIDYLSIAPYKHSRPTHVALLEAEVVIVEGLNLWNVPAGVYQLICLPVKLGGSDGAPTRAILIED